MSESNNISTNNKRIAKNAMLLYIRMFIVMIISLYTSRVVLRSLGVVDYGIYNVVGGVVSLFSALCSSLSFSISRFMTFELGRGEKERLRKVFSMGINIQVFMALVIVLLVETVGLWFLLHKMVIPDERIGAAIWVLQMSTLTFVLNIISVPYNAAIIAHEKMRAFAYISVFECVCKLIVALCISLSPIDHLAFYSVALCVVALILRLIYGIYCSKKFEECHYTLGLDRPLLKEMSSFAGWNFLAYVTGLTRDQGGNIIINLFCGPAVNAARGISIQVYGVINNFVDNFMTALKPQITKQYAAQNNDYVKQLVFQGARLGYFILLILCVPILLNIDYILELWLVDVPAHTSSFIMLVILFVLSESLSTPISTAIQATGSIKRYSIRIGMLQILNFPLYYILLYANCFPEVVLIVSVVTSQLCLIVRLIEARKMLGMSIGSFVKDVYIKVISISIIAFLIPYGISLMYDIGMHRLLITTPISVVCSSFIIYMLGCSKEEKSFVRSKVVDIKKKIVK